MRLVMRESKLSNKEGNLVYKCSCARVYENVDAIRVVGDAYMKNCYKSNNHIAEEIRTAFKEVNASNQELRECLKALNLSEHMLESNIQSGEETAQHIEKWSFRISCYSRDNIMDDTNYDLSYIPEHVREDLAYQIIHYPSSLIKLVNDEAISKNKEELDEATLMHWGNLDKGIKADSKAIMSGRGTGHFGTGFYFVNKEHFGDMKYDYKPNRPIYELDTSSYNLFIPKTNGQAYSLHTYLKIVNELKDSDFNKYDEHMLERELDDIMYYEEPPALLKFIKKYYPEALKWDDQLKQDIEDKRWLAVEEYCKDIIRELASRYDRVDIAAEQLAGIFNKTREELYKLIRDAHFNKASLDSTSTLLMKSLGYEGVDVSKFMTDSDGLQGLDNFEYGSVIYDVKPGTYKRIIEPRKKEQ